ncbi:MAG: hydrogenase maturation nickel metallochaperone HypA [Nitrospira sp.]|nr:hydrogenase maturation nickel metallochaperone HypA [Nitrospira sp.]
MHEFHLMGQVVKAVEERLRSEPKAKPVLVRLKIQASSHLLAQDPSSLTTAFALAAQGTTAESAKLEIIPVLAGEALPEVLVHEIVVEE